MPIATIEHAEIDFTDPIRHTGFRLLGCVTCRKVVAFPRDNYLLCTDRFVGVLNEALKAQGWKVPIETR